MYQRDSEKEQVLWQQYWGASQPDSSALVNHFMPFAHMLAKKYFKLFGFEHRDFDDFVQNANLGLIDAIGRFDKEQGVDFHAYASIRIKGSILNGIKQLSEKSHYHAYVKRMQSERRDSIVNGSEQASKSSLDNIGSVIIELAYSHLLEEIVEDGSRHQIESPNTPYAICGLQQAKNMLSQYLKRLPERENQILKWHYFEYLSFQEICELMGITKGRVSQLHHQALRRLKEFCSNTPELIV